MFLVPNRFDIIPYEDLSLESTWKRIGKGSFGCVFQGEYLGLQVAIKEVLDSSEYDVDKYFKRELTIMQESRHPNIVQYVGLCVAPLNTHHTSTEREGSEDWAQTHFNKAAKPRQRILIISEFLQGGNVRHYIAADNLPFPWRLRLSFCVDAARALAYMHARKCMHRDLKGENMLITENHRVKVCDFGFARIAARNADEMRRISFCGTDGYMSPEILMGLDFGLETDIFSLGIIFCEILTRTLVDSDTMARPAPFFAVDPAEVKSIASPGCPPAFLDLALHCCDPEPQKRPNMREVLLRLRTIEQQVLEEDEKNIKNSAEKTYNIGSLNFGGGLKTKKQLARPSMPGKIPSFDGAVKVPSRHSSISSSSSQGEEAIEDVLKALEDVGLDGSDGDESWCDPSPGSNYSTMVIGKGGSKRNSVIHSLTGSSIMTVRPDAGDVKDRHETHKQQQQRWEESDAGGIPSLPASWLANASPSAIRLLSKDQDDRGIPANRLQSELENLVDIPASAAPSSIKNDSEGPSSTHVVVNGETTDGGGDEDDIFFSAPSVFDQALHRFSLVRPGWKLFTTSDTPEKAISQLKDIRQAQASQGQDAAKAVSEVLLRGEKHRRSGLELHGAMMRCEFCKKRLGWMKPHLICDDCGFHCHVHCGDIAPRSCGMTDDSASTADPDQKPSTTASSTSRKNKGKLYKLRHANKAI